MSYGLLSPASFLKTRSPQEFQRRFTVRAGLDISAHDYKDAQEGQIAGVLKPGLTLLFPLNWEGGSAVITSDSESSPLHFYVSTKTAYLIFARAPLRITYDM